MNLIKRTTTVNKSWEPEITVVPWLKSTDVIKSTFEFDDGSVLAVDVLCSLDQLIHSDQMILLVDVNLQTHLVVTHLTHKAGNLDVEDYVKWLYETSMHIDDFTYDIIQCGHELVWGKRQTKLGLFLVNDDWTQADPLVEWEYRRGMVGASVATWLNYDTLVAQLRHVLVDKLPAETDIKQLDVPTLQIAFTNRAAELVNVALVTKHELHYFRVVGALFSANIDCSMDWGNVHSIELASKRIAGAGRRAVLDISTMQLTPKVLIVN